MSYHYIGIELSPKIFKELLIELFDGKQFKRRDAIEAIMKYHKELGGLCNKADYSGVFKNVSKELKNKGLSNPAVGTWRLNYKKENLDIIPSEKVTPKMKQEITANKVIGKGLNAVYIYYFDVYKKLAEAKNEKVWECKVGRTDNDPLFRVINQTNTCYPEFPTIAIIFYCEDSYKLEKALHSILNLNNKHIESAPGKEWFKTNPEEVEKIYNSIILEN